MSGKQAMPLRQIDLPITFRDLTNYRMETLTFEVVRFHGTYHAILGHPCYSKFMAIPNYTYLKLKMTGPYGVITIGISFQRAYECEVECYEHAAAIVASRELAAIRKVVTEEAPDPKRHSKRSHEHALKIRLGSTPVKQRLCCFDEEKRRAIGEEIAKLLAAEFIKEVYHPEWLANLNLAK
ncbi:uncharacterized protein [Miscanthus floridulus]|uniref:uncharacterized protein n=1 Tax=Miscanthus floridulus TaxID=154761 RepID=UPI003458B002